MSKSKETHLPVSQPCPVDVLTDLLERLVDAQISQSEKMGQLRNMGEQSAEEISWIKSQFRNGFRSEIKGYISNAERDIQRRMDEIDNHVQQRVEAVEQRVEDVKDEVQKKLDQINKDMTALHEKVDLFRKPSFWVKIGVAFVIAVVTFVRTMDGFVSIWQEQRSPKTVQKVQYEPKNEGDTNGKSPNSRPWQ